VEAEHARAKTQTENFGPYATQACGDEVTRFVDENYQADSKDDLEYAC
jgi:hypothetical protein